MIGALLVAGQEPRAQSPGLAQRPWRPLLRVCRGTEGQVR